MAWNSFISYVLRPPGNGDQKQNHADKVQDVEQNGEPVNDHGVSSENGIPNQIKMGCRNESSVAGVCC